ncbi:MAG: UPF0262 family protein [Methylocystis sp.]|nr:UPF0262 family protein [Methylocystis sp.]MCA3583154.1 UPF0262 family protein [Methylocystis sp.]MCA3587641.1 UPF0262 family protein [Methylocystis sp.]MCA3590768.1 UPF0262 family protein [Methylocystis sp.]
MNRDPSAKSTQRLVSVVLDAASIERGTPDQEHERLTAIYDLVEENKFALPDGRAGPFALHISMMSGRLAFDIRTEDGRHIITHGLSLSPFRRVIKDYFMICESYYEAIRTATAEQIEAIDMGRRGIHNEAAEIVIERLKDKVSIDFQTARRIFTLLAALSWTGRET